MSTAVAASPADGDLFETIDAMTVLELLALIKALDEHYGLTPEPPEPAEPLELEEEAP